MKDSKFSNYVAPIVVLVGICFVITLALAFVNHFAAPVIADNEKATADANRVQLLPDGDTFSEYTGELLATDDGKVYIQDAYTADNGAGVVITAVTKSFGGDLTEMIGIDKEGAITGVVVTKHSDTAGLGTKAHDPGYLKQYKGVTELQSISAKDESKAGNGISYVTGASISSNAVHYGIYEALQQFEAMGGAK